MGRGRTIAAAALLAASALGSAGLPAAAADLGLVEGTDIPAGGVPCEAPVVQAFPAVWQGHFKGGYSHYLGEGSVVVLDWRDEKLCFPDRGSCKRYVTTMRRDFHRPEGYFTCLPIR